MALTPEQRFAQRRLVGIIRSGSLLTRETGLNLWRGSTDSSMRTTVGEVTACLDVLEIPYVVRVGEPGPYKKNNHLRGTGIRVAWDDLGKLVRWMPSYQRTIDAVEAYERERADQPD